MTDPRPAPYFDVREIPFSYHGSWFCISAVIRQGAPKDDLHLVSHQTGMHAIFAFRPLAPDGARADMHVEACPFMLSWLHESGRVDLVYESSDTVRLRGDGLGMRIDAVASALTPFSGTYLFHDAAADGYVFTSYETGRRYRISVVRGALTEARGIETLGTAERSVVVTPDAQAWELAIEEYQAARKPYVAVAAFDQVADAAAAEFASFRDAVAP
jgi:hypothetical protein